MILPEKLALFPFLAVTYAYALFVCHVKIREIEKGLGSR